MNIEKNRQIDKEKYIWLIDKQKKQYAETEGWKDWIYKHKGETNSD